MKLKTVALMGVICTAAFLSSCKKDDDKKEEPKAVSVEGTWKTTALTMTTRFNGVDSTEDMYADMEPCEKDDLLRFNADKTVTDLPGATKCDPSETAESGGTWALSDNNTKLTTSDGVYDVVTLSATTLKLRMKDEDSGVTYTINVTLARQ